jgi:hypothetical protein
MMSGIAKAIASVLLLMFLFGLAVQYNDPDPWRWAAIYAAAAVSCMLALLGRMPRWLPVIVALAAAIWATSIAPNVVGRVAPGEMFQEFEMKSPLIEQAREMFGLLIITAGMLLLIVTARKPVRR